MSTKERLSVRVQLFQVAFMFGNKRLQLVIIVGMKRPRSRCLLAELEHEPWR